MQECPTIIVVFLQEQVGTHVLELAGFILEDEYFKSQTYIINFWDWLCVEHTEKKTNFNFRQTLKRDYVIMN